MSRTISDLLAQVPTGQSRIFSPPLKDEVETRFVCVRFEYKYGPPLDWSNRPDFMALPWMGSRNKPRIGIGDLEEPQISFDDSLNKLVDFYWTGTGAFVISEKLIKLIDGIDPGSLEIRSVVISTRDGTANFFMVMPVRNLSAVDPDRTECKIYDDPLGHIFVRKISFPKGVVFQPGLLEGVHNFSDIDLPDSWLWSRELVDQAKSARIRGLYTTYPGTITGEVDSL